MKAGWKVATIGEACEVEYGTRVVQKRDAGTAFPVYGGGDATFFVDSFNRVSRVVVSRFGMSEQCTRFVGGEFFLNDSGLTLSPKDPSTLLPAFLDQLTLSLNDQIFALGKGAAQKNLDVPAFRNLQIRFPACLSEQRRIVAILDEAFEAIASAKTNTEKNLQNASSLFRSYLETTCCEVANQVANERLEAVCKQGRVITYGVIKLGDHVDEGVPCLRTSNVRWLEIDTAGMKRIRSALSNEYARTILRGGEVLVNVRGTLGGVAAVPTSMAGWNVSREVAVVPVDERRIDPLFAAFWIGTKRSQSWLAGVKKGAAYTGINIEDLRNLPVPVPSHEIQFKTVEVLQQAQDAMNRLVQLMSRKLAALEELKQSLLHQAFTGQLTSQRTDQQVAELA